MDVGVADAFAGVAPLAVVDALWSSGPAQAVALMTVADRVQLDNVRLVSHQDTFYVRRPAPGAPARVFMRASLVEGDVDVVFGHATLVIDDSTLLSRADRLRALGHGGGHVLAPSTPAAQALGLKGELAKQADAFSSYFSERHNALAHQATSDAVANYFVGRDLGMALRAGQQLGRRGT